MRGAICLVQKEKLALKRWMVLLLALATSACGIPKDPEGTLDRVSGSVLRVGVTEATPWVDISASRPGGIEVGLVEAFAGSIDAEIEWVEGSEAELAQALSLHEIDLLIGGLTSTSALASEVTLTHPYTTTATVIGVPDDSEVPTDIAGVQVAAEFGSVEAGLLAKTDAEVLRVDDVTAAEGAVAIEDIFLDDLSLTDTGIRLQESDHVMGAPHGENAFLVALERFLLEHDELAQQLIEQAQP